MEEKGYQSFEDLLIWKEAMRFSVEICQLFRDSKDYGFKDQIQRASVSVPSNIAEGFERQTKSLFDIYSSPKALTANYGRNFIWQLN